MIRKLLLFLLVLTGVAVAGQGAGAQQPNPLAVALVPSRLELSLQPGDTESHALTLLNKGDRALQARVHAVPVDLGELEDTYVVDPREVPVSAADWVRVSPQDFSVLPSQEQLVNVDISPPRDASLGSYQAVVFFELVPEGEPAEATGVTVQARVGGMVLLDVVHPGQELVRRGQATNGRLEVRSHHLFAGWKPDLGALVRPPETRARVDLYNVGNAYLIALGAFNFGDAQGGEPSERVGPLVVFQGTAHTFTSGWQEAPFLGSTSVGTQLVYAKGTDGLITIPEEYSAWIIPWAWFEALAILLGPAAIIFFWRRRKRRRPVPALLQGAATEGLPY